MYFDYDQRSAVVMHDSAGESKMSKVSSSFSKAAFVTSDNSDQSNDVALDDPDFWTKVVGLASGQGKDENGRKRKCTLDVVSYKEPNFSMRQFEEESTTEKKKGQEKLPPAIVAAEWTEENILKLTWAIASRGYGNWDNIKSDTKLNWSMRDITRGCRISILRLLYAACLPSGQETDEGLDDAAFIEGHLRSFRACRLALLAELLDSTTESSIDQHNGDDSKDVYILTLTKAKPNLSAADVIVSVDSRLLDLPDDLSFEELKRLISLLRQISTRL